MPRAYPLSDYADAAPDAGTGEWQALRGELVALLDKVETHYGQAEAERGSPVSGLTQRVRHLRDQVGEAEPAWRRREALRTVKRAVDRFNERDPQAAGFDEDDLTAAIAEIRTRQGAAPQAPRRATEMPEMRELGALVGGMSQRLERLEGELKSQRNNSGQVREVASQVEQLTQVVELLAGAVGETGQVKRLEAQIGALAAMIEDTPKVDLGAINARLDDVSATVGKLAELQVEQMEREIARDKRQQETPKAEKLAPAMAAIEDSVRTVYDRIDAIERSVALSAGDFERLTTEMAAFTKAMRDNSAAPNALVGRVEALAERLEGIDSANGEVAALKNDIAALRDAVMGSMEPRFSRIESQIEALSSKVKPVDTKAVESQLKALMARLDEAGSQLDGLARLYASGEDRPDFDALATLVAERTSDAVARKAKPPVAMFGPDSLKSIEDRISGLIRSAGKTPDYETLAELVATRASEAVARSGGAPGGVSEDSMNALEKRMTALLNTAGKDTTERLARLEAMLRSDAPPAAAAPASARPAASVTRTEAERRDPFEEALEARRGRNDALDSIMAGLGQTERDAMPANPADDAPLVDPGFRDAGPVRSALAARAAAQPAARSEGRAAGVPPHFDAGKVERPPRPQSSLAPADKDPFSDPPAAAKPAAPEPVAATPNTSTFVAAARRAQRARQEQAETPESNSIIGRALARVKSRKDAEAAPAPEAAAEAPKRPSRADRKAAAASAKAARPEAVAAETRIAAAEANEGGFLARHRRPLLLAATLVAVSMLALNLVLQRMGPAHVPPAPTETSRAADNPAPSDDQSSIVPPRVIDLIDTTSTGSINPGEPMSFSKAAVPTGATTPMPPALSATSRSIELAPAEPAQAQVASPEVTGSIGSADANTAPVKETFELPPEAIGPLPLREAAASGDARAQFEVAAIYGEGQAIAQKLDEAAIWYERSAAQGFVPAQYRLGNLFEVGTGVDKNLEQARLWYQRGAEAGNRMAMHNLAALYASGQLGEQQFDLAAEWFAQAAARGMTDSQFNLGMLYARGLGVDQDFEQSYKWFSLAARNGDKDAAQARDDIAKSLTADAVSRINAEVAAWTIDPIDLAANFAPIGTWTKDFDPGKTITSRDVIAKVQMALAKLGFDIGTPDGVAGPKTAEAIRSFERAIGMSETGAINPRLLAVLGSQPV